MAHPPSRVLSIHRVGRGVTSHKVLCLDKYVCFRKDCRNTTLSPHSPSKTVNPFD